MNELLNMKTLNLFPLLSSALLLPLNQINAADEERPNIVVFIADDAGMDYGCYGNPHIHTPNIDALAAKGVRFENAFITSPQSSPSRTSMLSGYFPHTIGTEDLHTPLPDSVKILPAYLKEAGYRTGIMLKGHIGNTGMSQFDWYDEGFPLYFQDPVEWETTAVDRFSTFVGNDKDTPFFLWVGFVDPHRVYNDHPIEKKNEPDKVVVPPYLIDDAETRRDIADYYDEISRMDTHIGEMMDVLKAKGILENTIVLYLSDNGKPFPRAKGTLYDEGIRTPLIVSWQKKIRPAVQRGLVSSIGLMPTLLRLAGTVPPGYTIGDFSSLLFDENAKGNDAVFAERNWHSGDEYMRCIRTYRYKLIYNAYFDWPLSIPGELMRCSSFFSLRRAQRENRAAEGQKAIFACPRPVIELYDLYADPNEFVNLAGDPEYTAVGTELLKKLYDWQEKTKDHPWWTRRMTDNVDRITGFPLGKAPEYWVK